MAFDERLANRIREILSETHDNIEEKKMFGGLCFMVDDKMCAGVKTNKIMFRINPAEMNKMLEKPGVQPMLHGKKIMKGFVFVENDELKTKKQLNDWLELSLSYNKLIKAKKK